MSWGGLLLLGVAACGPSMWDRHKAALRDDAADGHWEAAMAEQQWLITNAFMHAPVEDRTREAEAARQLHLARLAGKAGDNRTAVQALREALATDPSQAGAVRAQLDTLRLSPAEAEQVKYEFAWNLAALAPGEDALAHAQPAGSECWSYRVQEVRIRQQRTLRTANGMERQVTYDARPWVYDARAHRWAADGAWVDDVGTESEPLDGPPRPRYRAVVAAEHEFYADGAVPPCHRQAWRGPFETDGTVFVATQLPKP
jgi:hypothetical protein